MRLLIFITAIIIAFSAVAQNKPQGKNEVSNIVDANSADIRKIEKYLNSITTLATPFNQENSDGERASGMFYLARPGRLRWDYAPPTPILIVAKGSLVAYYDKELDEVSHISIDDTLAGLLTRKEISFGKDGVNLIDFKKENNEMQITVSQNDKEEQGNLTMVFSEGNIKLLRMEVVDSIGKTTSVAFDTLVYNKPLDKKLFALPRVQTKLR